MVVSALFLNIKRTMEHSSELDSMDDIWDKIKYN